MLGKIPSGILLSLLFPCLRENIPGEAPAPVSFTSNLARAINRMILLFSFFSMEKQKILLQKTHEGIVIPALLFPNPHQPHNHPKNQNHRITSLSQPSTLPIKKFSKSQNFQLQPKNFQNSKHLLHHQPSINNTPPQKQKFPNHPNSSPAPSKPQKSETRKVKPRKLQI